MLGLEKFFKLSNDMVTFLASSSATRRTDLIEESKIKEEDGVKAENSDSTVIKIEPDIQPPTMNNVVSFGTEVSLIGKGKGPVGPLTLTIPKIHTNAITISPPNPL